MYAWVCHTEVFQYLNGWQNLLQHPNVLLSLYCIPSSSYSMDLCFWQFWTIINVIWILERNIGRVGKGLCARISSEFMAQLYIRSSRSAVQMASSMVHLPLMNLAVLDWASALIPSSSQLDRQHVLCGPQEPLLVEWHLGSLHHWHSSLHSFCHTATPQNTQYAPYIHCWQQRDCQQVKAMHQ